MEDEQKPLSKTRFSVRVALWLKKNDFSGGKNWAIDVSALQPTPAEGGGYPSRP
jgi:hypothetical protein